MSKREDTRKLILERALLHLQKASFDTLTMRELAESCGLSLGAFYYHFKSKEEIILEFFNQSLQGHLSRTRKYLGSRKSKPSLAEVMSWICEDRMEEFESYRSVLRVLAQRLDPEDPLSPWSKENQSIREQSIELFEEVLESSLPGLKPKSHHQLAQALWLQHLLILGAWSFDRTKDSKNVTRIIKQSKQLWKTLPALLKVPGVQSIMSLVLSPLGSIHEN